MGVHVEWMDAKYTSVGVIEAGAMWDGEIVGPDNDQGEDVVNAGNVAITLGGDTVVVVEGTPDRLRELLQRALDGLPAPVVPPFPMPDDAAEGDEVTCPHVDASGKVCGQVIEVTERVWDYRPVHWVEALDGTLTAGIGDGQLGDGEFHSFACESGHQWAPDWDRTDYR